MGLFMALFLIGQVLSDRKRRGGNDFQQRATGWDRTVGHYSKDTATVHGLLYRLSFLGAPTQLTFKYTLFHNYFFSVMMQMGGGDF